MSDYKLQLSVKINNIDLENSYVSHDPSSSSISPIKIINNFPTINWEFNIPNKLEIDSSDGDVESFISISQGTYEIRISKLTTGIGTDSFVGLVASSGSISTEDRFWKYVGIPLGRGATYYGQLFVVDEYGQNSNWYTFSFYYNNLPYITNLVILPNKPYSDDDLYLSYTFYDIDGDIESNTLVYWYRNGEYQKQLDNLFTIKSFFSEMGDIWSADVVPCDGYEYGIRVSSDFVEISKTEVILSDIRILPINPNENDILKADYKANIIFLEAKKEVDIKWYINTFHIDSFDNQKFIRPFVVPGDTVYYDIKIRDTNVFYSSPSIEIISSDFKITDILVDGKKEPLDILILTPIIRWKVYSPYDRQVEFISIKIGTFYQANNIYSEIIESDRNYFVIPSGVLSKGMDYYISISVSDTKSFTNYAETYFRTKGSRWEESVDNSIGWTIETILEVTAPDAGEEESSYQVIRFEDGSFFGEIKIYINKISFVSGEIIESGILNLTGYNIITVVGEGRDVKIYLNKKLLLDGTGLFTKRTTNKKLEIGNYTGKEFEVNYKYFYYTVGGAYSPDLSSEYKNLQFHTLLNFANSEVIGLKDYLKVIQNNKNYTQDKKIFAINPDDTEEGGKIYALVPGQQYKIRASNSFYDPINQSRYYTINNISRSENTENIIFSHTQGATIIKGYVIYLYDQDLGFVRDDLVNDKYPEEESWYLVQNMVFNAAYYDNNGFNINTVYDRGNDI